MENRTSSFVPGQKPVVLVTGASGLIGSNIINRLADKYQCVGLDRTENVHANIKTENIYFDITDHASIEAALGRVRFAYGDEIASVIHLAAYYDFSGEPSPLYDKVTVKGTDNFLTALQKLEVKQFIFSSTNLVYKPTVPGEKIDEEWPLEPAWDYPESKVKTEEIIHHNKGNIPVVIVRIAGVYDEEGHSIPITHQIQRIYEKNFTSYFYPGDLLHGNAFIHLDDLNDALVSAVEKRNELPQEIIINLSEPRTYGYEELQDEMGNLIHGTEWNTIEIPKPLAKVGAWVQDLVSEPFIKPWMIDRADDHFEMDITKAQKYLNWKPKHDLKSTLSAMIENLKADPGKWYKENKLES
jgi:UDP-glucose 4-epimerase